MRVMKGMNFDEIATALGIHASTIAKWSKTEDWEHLRMLKNSSSLSIELNAAQQISLIFETIKKEGRVATAAETDQMVKLYKMIDTLNKDMIFVQNGIEVMGLFMEYMRTKDDKLFQQLAEHAVDFVKDFAAKYSRGPNS